MAKEAGVKSREHVDCTMLSRLSYRDAPSRGVNEESSPTKKVGNGITLGGGLGELVERALDEAVNPSLASNTTQRYFDTVGVSILNTALLTSTGMESIVRGKALHLIEPEILALFLAWRTYGTTRRQWQQSIVMRSGARASCPCLIRLI